MATGGAYANPDVNVGVDRQSGQMIGNAIASIGQNIGAGIEKKQQRDDIAAERRRKEAEKARIRAEQNWQISKQVESQKTQEVMEFQATLKANNIDMDSLDGSFRSVIDEMYAAKSRLAQSRSDYDGRKEDEAAIRNGQAFIGSIGEKFQTMNMLTSTWKEKFKTRNVPGGIDDSSSDPLFAAMMNIGEGDGEGINAGSVGWERRTGPGGKIQLFQVADSPMIRELNNGKPYELSYDQVSGFLNDEDNNPNTFGPFSLVPDHTKEINEAGKSAKIFLDGGAINKEQFYSKGTEYVAVDGLNGSYGEQLSWPNTAAMQGALGQMSKSAAEAELGFGGSSITANSNIRANAKNRKKIITLPNGEKKEITEYYFPTFGERDPQTGEIKETGEIILGDSMSGLMTQNNEDGTQETDGYSKEEYDNYLKFTNYMYMSINGAYADPEKIASEKREYINKPTGGGIKADEEIGKEYYEVFEDDPVRLWQSKTNDRTAEMVIDEETGEETNVIKVTRGDEEETFDLDDPAQKEFFLTEIMLSDPSLKGDSAAAKAKRDAVLANLGIEKEEEAISEEENPVALADISDLATEFEDISSSMISIIDSSNTFNRSENLEKMINTAVDKFKGINKNVSRDQIIQALIKMEKAKPDYAKKQKLDGALKYSKENKRVLDLEKLLEK
tara:strand:- start:3626 stop:5641 length:2016 start_codon:yes stop_codon:yes gene_type:complete